MVRRRMVLGEPAVRRPHQTTDRKVEARRAVLPLVVAVRLEGQYAVALVGMAQHVLNRAVDGRTSMSAALVRGHPFITDTAEHDAMPDPRDYVLVAGQPRDRADGGWSKNEPIAVPVVDP